MSWAEVKKINTNLTKPLDILIDERFSNSEYELSKKSLFPHIIASNTIQYSNDPVQSSGSTITLLEKQVVAFGELKISADLRISVAGDFKSLTLKVLLEDQHGSMPTIRIGENRTVDWVTVSGTVLVKPYDIIKIIAEGEASSYTRYVKNFRVYYDISPVPSGILI